MYFSRGHLSSLACAALFVSAHAEHAFLHSEMSFGQHDIVSKDMRSVQNFQLLGSPMAPQILSNKLIVTPPAPGNYRGAIWAEKKLEHSWWTADIDFRATGPERGGGNMQIWYAKDGRDEVGTASIYTAKKFDGLALVIDQYASSGGFVRGFLNDGKTEYKSHHSVDSLAFGHCQYSYRNLGRASRISIHQTRENFRVEVDGRLCFESPKIKLPVGNFFGISAASAETADSFEVMKFVVTTETHSPDGDNVQNDIHHEAMNPKEDQKQGQSPNSESVNVEFNSKMGFNDVPEVAAAEISSSQAQFADLHNRLQSMMRHILALNRDINDNQRAATSRIDDLTTKIEHLESVLERRFDAVQAIDRKLDSIMSDVRQTKAELDEALSRHIAGLSMTVSSTHQSMLASVAAAAPRIGMYIFVVVASQVMLVVFYLVYKRRKANSPKKYL